MIDLSDVKERLTVIETKFEGAEKKLDEIHSAIVGKEGLSIKVDRHDQIIQGWQKNINVIWVAITGLAVKAFWGLFNKNG